MSRPCCLLDPGQGHVHGGDPVPMLVQALVVGRLRFGMVSEDRRAAGLLSGPFPGVAASRELMDTDMALTVKEVRAVLLARGVVADDLCSTHIDVPDTTIGGVKHKKPTWHPFVHIAGQDRDCGCV